jgi:hypothetical protein
VKGTKGMERKMKRNEEKNKETKRIEGKYKRTKRMEEESPPHHPV